MGFGAKVHTCARNEDDLNKCLKDWNHLGFEVTGSICDVSVPQQREVLMEDVSSVFNGKLNILVSSFLFNFSLSYVHNHNFCVFCFTFCFKGQNMHFCC